MDCTHVLWDRAAKEIANQYKQSGCAKTPSFEVVVDHCRRIHHASKPFYGTTNDKRVMQNDIYPYDLVHNRVHGEREFRIYNSLGQPSKWQGAWLITDNGYSRSMSLQCPDHHATEHDEVMFVLNLKTTSRPSFVLVLLYTHPSKIQWFLESRLACCGSK